MELATTLTDQKVQNQIREVGINSNYWYAVGWSKSVKPNSVVPVKIWYQAIAVFRDEAGELHALEDACPHRGVALHKGIVQGKCLTCPYHGWEFNGRGECVRIPYLPESQKLPRANARSYPIQERYGLIWVFPGDPAIAATKDLPYMEEYGRDEWFLATIDAHCHAHFSMCNENAMDVFHGFLHKELQAWFDPVLTSLSESEESVQAQYQVSYKGLLPKLLGLTDRADRVARLPVNVQYLYPNFNTKLKGISSMYLMRLPVTKTESRSYACFFFRPPFPKWLLKLLAPPLRVILREFTLRKFLDQDKEMMESEQQTYLADPQRRYVEINPAIFAVQRFTFAQYEQFAGNGNGNGNGSSGAATVSVADSNPEIGKL